MSKRFVISGLVVLAATTALCWNIFGLSFAWTRNPRPILDCPLQFDLGVREHLESVNVDFVISNKGNATLQLKNFVSNCSCAGLYLKELSPKRIDSLDIQPASSVDVQLQLTVKGIPGSTQESWVQFRTNDPSYPTVIVRSTVTYITGGMYATPSSLAFGSLRAGDDVMQTLEILDDGPTPRSIDSVSSLDPKILSLNLLSPKVRVGEFRAPVVIGQLEVRPQTSRCGEFRSEIYVRSGDSQARTVCIPVTFRVAPPVEIIPNTLYLPRVTSTGPLYTGTVALRTPDNRPFSILEIVAPAGWSVTRAGPGSESLALLTVTRNMPPNGEEMTRSIQIQVKVRVDDKDHDLILSVQCK